MTETQYLVLLRGINVGGNNIIKMVNNKTFVYHNRDKAISDIGKYVVFSGMEHLCGWSADVNAIPRSEFSRTHDI